MISAKNMLIIAILVTVLVFMLDTITPRGVGFWVLYIIPVLLFAGRDGRKQLYLLLAVIAILMTAGMVVSPKGLPVYVSLLNRISAFVVIIIIAYIINARSYLQKQLQRRARDLENTNRDLESFSYSVSHDLRAPLSVIRNFSTILLEDHAVQLDDEGKDYLTRICANVKKMQKLIEDILSLSRVNRMEVKREKVDLSATVKGYLKELQESEPGRKVSFIIKENLVVLADPRLVHIALENLLRNAWKFTSKKEESLIEFGSEIQNGRTVFFVKDNGVGFDMQEAQRMFEPFKRVHSGSEFGGTGIGLSIVKRVVDHHGGSVWARGEIGNGAIFFFTFGDKD